MMVQRRRRLAAAGLAALVAAVTACSSGDDATVIGDTAAAPATDPRSETTAAFDVVTVVDDLGEVEVQAPAGVIVTTSDEATEMVVALGIRPVGIASTRVDATAPADERLADYFLSNDVLGEPEFVGGEALNFEAIAALDPDLIVHGADDEAVATLSEIAPTVVYDIQVPGRWQEAVRELGAATGTDTEAERLVTDYDDALAAARTELTDVAAANPEVTVMYPNYRGSEDNFVFDAEFALAAVVPELGFDLVGFESAEPAFPGVAVISPERFEDLATGADTIVAIGPNDWRDTASGPILESLTVPVLGLLVDEGRPSTGPLSAPAYLERFVAALTSAANGPATGAAEPDSSVGTRSAAGAESLLWSTLPAVQSDSVVTLDRLGYPGADGVGAFARDPADAVDGLG